MSPCLWESASTQRGGYSNSRKPSRFQRVAAFVLQAEMAGPTKLALSGVERTSSLIRHQTFVIFHRLSAEH
jgi:hypothetical protein